MTNADILTKLHADVAAASAPMSPPYTSPAERIDVSRRRKEARARLAALPGPALLERLVEEHAALEAISGPCDGPDECGICATIADCADALEVAE